MGSTWAEALRGDEGKRDVITTLLFSTALLLLDVPSKLGSAGSSLQPSRMLQCCCLEPGHGYRTVVSWGTDKLAVLFFLKCLWAPYCLAVSGIKLPALIPSYTRLLAFNMMLLFMFLMNYLDCVSGTDWIWLLNARGVWRFLTLLHTHEVTTSSSEIDVMITDPGVSSLVESFVIICGNRQVSVTAEMLLHRLTSSLSPTRNSGFITHADLDGFCPYLCMWDLKRWWGRGIWRKDEKARAFSPHRRSMLLL